MAYAAFPLLYSSVVTPEVEFISDPAAPYKRSIDPLCDGYVITINGKALPDADKFHVTLAQGKDKAFRVAPRFNEKVVVRNSKLNTKWGREEREGPLPLERDQTFDLVILVTESCYKIAFNGKHFCDFKHRYPMEQVNSLKIKGGVVIHSVKISDPHRGVAVPLCERLSRGAKSGTMVRIHGRPKQDANRFAFDFLSADKDDVAFHFNPRFPGNVVVRNTKTGGGWGREEREQPEFPFTPDKDFYVTIYIDSNMYQVSVNGEFFISYKHRMENLGQIQFFRVRGDVEVFSLQI